MSASRLNNDNARLDAKSCKRLGVVRDAEGFRGNIGVARYFRVRGHEVVFALKLQSVSAQINKCDGVGTRSRHLVDKIPKRAAQRLLIEITGTNHVKPGGLQRLRNQTGIIGGCRQSSSLIAGIANNQRDTRFGRVGLTWMRQDRRNQRKHHNQSTEMSFHGTAQNQDLWECIESRFY
jgi:hypothetical protein